MRFALGLISSAAFVLGMAAQENATTTDKLELYPNFQTLSVYAYFSGDANSNNATTLDYRPAGGGWRQGHPLTRISAGLWTGSIFWLTPGQRYEVRVRFSDPDGVASPSVTASAVTRNDRWPVGSGRTIHVAVNGAGDGSSVSRPLGSVQQAVDLAEPGDKVLIAPGVYRESVVVGKSGTPKAYILIEGRPGAILDGSDAGFLDRDGPRHWTMRRFPPAGGTTGESRGNYFEADCDWPVDHIVIKGEKYYGSKTFADMQVCASGPPGCWFQDAPKQKLYVHPTRGWNSPGTQETAVSRLAKGITLEGAHHVVIDGLEVRYFGKMGIDIRGSDNVVQNCLVRDQDVGININGKEFHNNTIQRCEVSQTSVYKWGWFHTKGTRYEVDNIAVRGGRGNVVRHNKVHGSFDGIGLSVWSHLFEPGWIQDTDIHDNHVYDCGDDGMEPEGTCTNLRFWNNRIHSCLMTMSIAPVTVGPAYFINETYSDFQLSALKIQVKTSGTVFLYNSTFHSTGYRQSVWEGSSPWKNLRFRNCIFSGTDYVFRDSGPPREGTVTFDYDDLYTPRPGRFVVWEGKPYSNLDEFRRAGYEQHGLATDPRFVDAAAGDFRLRPDSPLIDRGIHIPGINDGYAGKAPDIGSHEHRSHGSSKPARTIIRN